MDAVCSIFNPFAVASKSTKARPVCTNPQITFRFVGGSRLPCDDNIPKTNVAESALVTKKEHNKTTAVNESNVPKGYWVITTKNAVDVSLMAKAAVSGPRLIPIAPKIENHRKEAKEGAKMTPMINSRIVLPFDIRAINTPTKGAQAIHQAQ